MRQRSCWAAAVAVFLLAGPGWSQTTNACDLNKDGSVNKADMDLAVNMALGLTPCTSTLLGAGVCNVVVVQRVANAALGGPCVTGLAHSATLNWGASPSANVTGYNVYRGLASGGPYTRVNPSLITGLTFTDTNIQAGQTYYYVATTVVSGNIEGGYSNQVTAVVPSP